MRRAAHSGNRRKAAVIFKNTLIMEKIENHFRYAVILGEKIKEAIDEIGHEEIEGNLTDFFHALANVMPNMAYNQIMWKQLNALEFNHFANHLVFQYAKLSDYGEQTKSDEYGA